MSQPTKDQQRAFLRRERSKITPPQAQIAAEQITHKLKEVIDWSNTHSLHCYLPISKQNEVNTWLFLKLVWDEFPQVKTFSSIYRPDANIIHVKISADTDFKTDEFGIPIPKNYQEAITDKFDVIIVPLLGFDASLNRLGYGRGIYDTFLANQRLSRKIGIAFDESLISVDLGFEPHDQKLDLIITPTKNFQ